MKTEVIRKFRLKKGCKYILIVPESSGLSPADCERMDSEFIQLSIFVKTTKGIKVIQNEN